MRYGKLKEIQAETERFLSKLYEALSRAEDNDTRYRYNGQDDPAWDKIPINERDCHNTKESGAFKRAALDLKAKLSKL